MPIRIPQIISPQHERSLHVLPGQGMTRLLTHDRELVTGRIVDRPNRFVVRVDFGEATERVFLGDPGELDGIVEQGTEILCSPADDDQRATQYDAIATVVEERYVSVRAALANDLFEQAVRSEAIAAFADHTIEQREPRLPDHGRTDFLLADPSGDPAYVEVKSCTHVVDGVALFPDRPTKRGRRHLASLEAACEDGLDAHVVFVVQRADAQRFRPYRDVDPEFAERLGAAAQAGVGLRAITTEFDPPEYYLCSSDLPIDLD